MRLPACVNRALPRVFTNLTFWLVLLNDAVFEVVITKVATNVTLPVRRCLQKLFFIREVLRFRQVLIAML